MDKLEQLRNDIGVKLVGMDQSLGSSPLSYNPLTKRNPTTGAILLGEETLVTGAPPMPGPNMRLDPSGKLISYPPGIAPPLPPFSGSYGGMRLSRRSSKKNSSPSRMSRRSTRRRSTRKAGRKSRRSTRRSRK
jgi:hypothetical protein